MLDLKLYILQRATALVMAPFVLTHLAVMIYAVQGGLSASEILGRTQGSLGWALFYGLFVLAVSIHGSIGVRVIASEWLGLKRGPVGMVMAVVFLILLAMGARAVLAVTLP